MAKRGRGPGRPALDETERKTRVVQFRATEVEREELAEAADRAELTFSEWALRELLRAARRRRKGAT